jgi:hypothetical protein
MAAGCGDGIDHLGTEFRRELDEIGCGKRSQIRWNADPVEQGRFRDFGHRICLLGVRTN